MRWHDWAWTDQGHWRGEGIWGRQRLDVEGKLDSRGKRWMDGSKRVKIRELADVVVGGRSHHSLSVGDIIRVSLRSGI